MNWELSANTVTFISCRGIYILSFHLSKSSFCINITHENEIDNTINYLDLTITKNLQKKVTDLGIYHKPTSNTTAIHNKSRHPFQQKLSTFNSLIHRLITLPITKPYYKKEKNS